MTYEQALLEYDNILYKDKVSGAYARLFCDYIGIILGLLPVFLPTYKIPQDRWQNLFRFQNHRPDPLRCRS